MSDQSLPPPTAPENIGVSLRGFADEVSARRFGDLIAVTVRSISQYMSLERLDGITVAHDYDEALAQLERGFQPSRPLTRTSTDEISGVAMAPAVIRDGVVKAHLVFYAPYVLGLETEAGSDDFKRALYTVAHECAHVDDLKRRDEAFPKTILQLKNTDLQDSTLEPVASCLWEEYAACRLSAIFGPGQTEFLEQGLTSLLLVARNNANGAIREYRIHANVNQVVQEAGSHICRPLKIAAYLIGHLDGLGLDFDDVPETRDAIAKSPYFHLVGQLGDALRGLWDNRGTWKSYGDFDVLKVLVKQAYADGGLFLQSLPGGRMHVDIPRTPDTMPSGGQ